MRDELREVIRAVVREELDVRCREAAEVLTPKRRPRTFRCPCHVLGADGELHVNPGCRWCGGTGRATREEGQ